MTKKELFLPFAFAGLSILFALICLMVFISGGKSAKWISRKMKIGGLLLGFSAITAGTSCTTCYDAPNPEYFKFDGITSNTIYIHPENEKYLFGKVYMPGSQEFSFTICDTAGTIADRNSLVPLDGEFGEKDEAFRLDFKAGIPTGNYQLSLYNCDTAMQSSNYPIEYFSLIIMP